jgi:hypothetical protein
LSDLNAAAGRLEREVQLGRIIWAALSDPSAAADFPFDWIQSLLASVITFCQRKNFNPEVSPPPDIIGRSVSLYFTTKAYVVDLLRWALVGFPSAASGRMA